MSCYGLKGISIPPDIDRFFVEDFILSAPSAPVDLNQLFSEELRDKIRNESRLALDTDNPDIIFSGTISRFDVSSQAPQEGNTSALNRLEITVRVNLENLKDEEKNWQKSFSNFRDFESTEDLLSVQDELIDLIFEKLLEDIFNHAFTEW